jgi:predicted anti-sigma-YlaC factor YlaD
MTVCEEIRESIGPWLDGELPAEQVEVVSSHIAACAECAEEKRQLARLQSAVRAVLLDQAAQADPGSMWPELRRRIDAAAPWWRNAAQWTAALFRAPGFAWAVPGVIVLMLGAIYLEPAIYSWTGNAPVNSFATVESIDAYGRNVALFREHESKTTVIWLYQSPDSENEGAGDAADKGPAF